MSFNNTNTTNGTKEETAIPTLVGFGLSSLVVLVGVFGNCLSVAVLSRKAMRNKVSSLFLMSLSAADTFSILAGYIYGLTPRITAVDIATISTVTCKMEFTLLHGFHDMSSWILVAITGERTLAVVFPFKVKTMMTRKRVVITLITIALVMLALNSWFVYGYEIRSVTTETNETMTVCLFTDTSGFMTRIWPSVLALKTTVLPGTLMLLGSVCIIGTLWRKARQESTIGSQTTAGSKLAPISRLLLTLNGIYIVTTAPFSLYLVLNPSFYTSPVPGYQLLEDPLVAIVAFLFNVNHFVNFFAFHLQGTLFRKELRATISCKP